MNRLLQRVHGPSFQTGSLEARPVQTGPVQTGTGDRDDRIEPDGNGGSHDFIDETVRRTRAVVTIDDDRVARIAG